MSDQLQEAAGHAGQGSRKKAKRQQTESTGYLGDSDKSSENSSSTESTALQKALANPLVLDCIFANLRTQTLVRGCRLVNKKWNNAATRILKRRTDAIVKLNGCTNFEALEVCIESSRSLKEDNGEQTWEVNFPFREIYLQCSDEDFKNSPKKWLEVGFIPRFSSVFSRLRLSSSNVPDLLLSGLLSRHFSHIESLTLNRIERNQNGHYEWKKLFLNHDNPLRMEKLKLVVMGDDGGCDRIDQTFLRELLQSCPNVERIENFTDSHLPAIYAAGKLGVVKSLLVCWWCGPDPDENCPMPSGVETLIIADGNHDDDDDVPEEQELYLAALQPLLESNRESLRRLEFRVEIVDGTERERWPRLNNLTSLVVKAPIWFPHSVEEIFPALQSLHVDVCWGEYGHTDVADFVWQTPLLSVTKLELFQSLNYEELVCLFVAAPNVRQLSLHFDNWEIDPMESSDDSSSSFFTDSDKDKVLNPWKVGSLFENLETLRLSAMKLPQSHLDEFFTGISTSYVEKLQANPKLEVPTPDFIERVLRKGRPSVASLSGVKELIIGFTMSDWVTHENGRSNSISHVATQYGFNTAHKDLKVQFVYDRYSKNAHLIEKALEPVSGMVTSEPEIIEVEEQAARGDEAGKSEAAKGQGTNQEPLPSGSNPAEQNSEDNMSTESTTVQDVLKNDLILECILRKISTLGLLRSCRLVNKQWNKAATTILKRRTDAYVKVNGKTNLAALESCIASSADFPFREIDLECSEKDFKHSPKKWLETGLFRRFGTSFIRLRLTISSVPDIIVTSLLSGRFNHIESLTLNRIERDEWRPWPSKKFVTENQQPSKVEKLCLNNGIPVNLGNLKTVAMGNDGGCDRINLTFLEQLLQSCPKLECIKNFTNAHLTAISNAGKLGLVKSLRACWCIDLHGKYPRPTGVEKLILADGNHEHDDDFDGLSGHELYLFSLLPLLEANRETLRRIEVRIKVYGGRNVDEDDWPMLSKLTSLDLMEGVVFPYSVDEIFPALKSLHVGPLRDEYGYVTIRHCIWRAPLLSVTNLEISESLSYEDLTDLSRAVPNVRHLRLFGYRSWDIGQWDFSPRSYEERADGGVIHPWGAVGYFEQLETLHVYPVRIDDSDLTEFITGIPEDCVEVLKANPHLEPPTPEFIDCILRENASVASLSSLRELVLGFTTLSDPFSEEYARHYTLSHVFMQYGLNTAPKGLKIRFLYDRYSKNARFIEEALRPASGKVTFGHWNPNLKN